MKLVGKKEAKSQETGNEAVKVLGGGCASCHALEEAAKAALTELGLPDEVGHITDFAPDRGLRGHADPGPDGGRQGGFQRTGTDQGGSQGPD